MTEIIPLRPGEGIQIGPNLYVRLESYHKGIGKVVVSGPGSCQIRKLKRIRPEAIMPKVKTEVVLGAFLD